MENIIRSDNVYLKMKPGEGWRKKGDNEEKNEEVPSEDDDDNNDYASLTNKRKRELLLPHWSRSNDDDEKDEYTDWTLDVTANSKGISGNDHNDDASNIKNVVISYSVHRCLLGNKSEYFKGIFRGSSGGGFSESHQKRSAIVLPGPGVTIHHFEILLDYLYTDRLVVDSNNAVAMVYFGDYFGINLLQNQAIMFIHELIAAIANSFQISPKSLATFYQDAKGLAMEELQEAIVFECASTPRLMIQKDSILLSNEIIPHAKLFWLRVWAARKSLTETETEVSTKMYGCYILFEVEASVVQ